MTSVLEAEIEELRKLAEHFSGSPLAATVLRILADREAAEENMRLAKVELDDIRSFELKPLAEAREDRERFVAKLLNELVEAAQQSIRRGSPSEVAAIGRAKQKLRDLIEADGKRIAGLEGALRLEAETNVKLGATLRAASPAPEIKPVAWRRWEDTGREAFWQFSDSSKKPDDDHNKPEWDWIPLYEQPAPETNALLEALGLAEKALTRARSFAGHENSCRAMTEGGTDYTVGLVCSCGWALAESEIRVALAAIHAAPPHRRRRQRGDGQWLRSQCAAPAVAFIETTAEPARTPWTCASPYPARPSRLNAGSVNRTRRKLQLPPRQREIRTPILCRRWIERPSSVRLATSMLWPRAG